MAFFLLYLLYLFLLGNVKSNQSILNNKRIDILSCPTDNAAQVALKLSDEKLFWKTVGSNLLNSDWNEISLPSIIKAVSNPKSICYANNTAVLFLQSSNGQVYGTSVSQSPGRIKFGEWMLIGGKLPLDEGYTVVSRDGISLQHMENKVHIFVRSFTNSSHLYLSKLDLQSLTTTTWNIIGGTEKALLTDAAVAFNSFTKLLEAFMISTDGYLYRSWQVNDNKWESWDKTGYSAPKSSHAPVIHSMDTNLFNGRLNVFIHGEDNLLHHIWQTTCDKVPNPWGWCTWSTWNTIGGRMPQIANVVNTLAIGHNIHLGIEVFLTSATGHLYKVWQLDRHETWSKWEKVTSNTDYEMYSLPVVVNNLEWWTAYALDSSGDVISITQTHMFALNPSTVMYSRSFVASWKMPIDEASNKDWIAIYPENSISNEDYLDYSYVGGSQNPLSDAVPEGDIAFDVYLPEGTYIVKYLIDKRFISAANTKLITSSGSTEREWVQIFRGIFIGLNLRNVSVESCVKDAESIPAAFDKAFKDFEDKFMYTGLNDLGKAIGLVVTGMKDCGIEGTTITLVEKFVTDLVSCVKGSCLHFVIDIGKELLVLYENIYEIYSDIRAASNCFKIKAYSQGSYNVGRVIAACIALPN